MPDAPLALENVSVTYGTGPAAVSALRDVTLRFKSEEMALVMGPSGSGKTTLLSVLGCLLRPGNGRVQVNGRDVTGLSEDARSVVRRDEIGYVFQAFRLFRSLSALQNVLLALEISGRGGRTAGPAALDALEAVGLADKRHLMPNDLSAGEKQRVAIARVLVKDPQIILADEPTASLDGAAGRQVAEMMVGIVEKRGRLVVMVTHDPRMVPFGHRIVEMQDGRLADSQDSGTGGDR